MSGSIRRRGAHSWELKIELDRDHTGQRRRRFVSFRGTRKAAATELARLISQEAVGEGIDPTRETLAEFAVRWDRDWLSLNVSPKSLERYQQIIRLYVLPHIGGIRMQKLRAAHLVELYARLSRGGGHEGQPLAPASVGYVHRVLHRMLGHAHAWDIVATNVAGLVSPPSVPETEINILNEAQIGAVLRHLEGRSLRPIVALLLGTGCRRGEALALRWKDLDLDQGSVRIERSIEETKGNLRVKEPKTRHGRRNVSIPPWLVAELRAHRARQQERRLALGQGGATPNDLVFPRWDGSIRSPHGVSQKFAQAMTALGIDCTLHGLRHTAVSLLIAGGADILQISRRIGHANAATTLRIYAHALKNTDTRAAEIMEAAFRRVGTE